MGRSRFLKFAAQNAACFDMMRATLGLDRSSPVYFAGRATELAALDAHLADIRRGERYALIDGIPGVGKTQLALRDNGEVFFPLPSFHGCMMSFAPPSRRGPNHGPGPR